MAIGTISHVRGAGYAVSNKRARVRDIQLTTGANYTTGGSTILPSDVGLHSKIEQVLVHGLALNAAGTGSVAVAFNNATQKLQAYFSVTTAANAEVANGTDLSTYTVRVTFIGV